MALSRNLLASGPRISRALRSIALRGDYVAPYLAALTLILTFGVAVLKALYKPLWYDELLSVFIAKLPHISDIWSLCKTGADGQPPAYDYLARASIRLFGSDPLGLRFPSIVGYLLFCICLYRFVGRRTSKLYGLAALLLTGLTGCWYYATEGRPYALILASTGVAAVSWQSISRNAGRKWALAGLFLSLSCAINLHYYAPLLLVPFGIAELARSWLRRKLDPVVWLCLIAPLLFLIPYVPLLRGGYRQSGSHNIFLARPGWYGSLADFISQFLGPGLVALAAAVCAFFILEIFSSGRQADLESRTVPSRSSVLPDAVLVLSLACILPLLGIAAGKLFTHVLYVRYVIGSMFGVVSLITFLIFFASMRRREPALICVVIFAFVFAYKAAWDVRDARGMRAHSPYETTVKRIPAIARYDAIPIAVVYPGDLMDLRYYGGPALQSRLYYLADETSAVRAYGFTSGERTIYLSAPYFGTQLVDYHAFIKRQPVFYVFGGPGWLVPKLIEDGADVQVLQAGPADTLGDNLDFFFRVRIK